MKITSVAAVAVSIPRLQPFVSSLGQHRHGENAIIEIHTDENIVGFGEASSIWDSRE